MKARIGKNAYTIIPDGTYYVKVISIEEVHWSYINTQAWQWTFEIAEGVYSGCRLQGHTNLHSSLGPRQKVGRWFHALAGTWLNEGDEIDTTQLLNITCLAKIFGCYGKSGKLANKIELVPKEDE